MERFLKYYREKKGIAIVWIALLLFVLLVFAATAIDIAYMYYAKEQLQIAADAAATAGAAKLSTIADSDTSAYGQLAARQEAWKFACKNTAASDSVFLETNSSVNCDNPPTDDLNEVNNLDNHDIVVGHWETDCPSGCAAGGSVCEYAGSGYFCRATGNTGLIINALKTRPQRSEESKTYGMPKVKVFLGQVFRYIGINWGYMTARAEAIATRPDLDMAPFPLCFPTCGTITSLTPLGNNNTPGLSFFFKIHDGTPNVGWTTFLDSSSSQPDITDYVLGNQKPPPICHECIYTTQGIVNPAFCAMRQRIQNDGADYVVNEGTENEVTIHGWKVLIPILANDIGCFGGTGCFVDPGTQGTTFGDPFYVRSYSDIIITDVVPSGNCPGDNAPVASGKPRIVVVGTGTGGSGYSTISCFDCDDPSSPLLLDVVKLVK